MPCIDRKSRQRGQTLQLKNLAAADRFHCPFPGCDRSFAELWRLKVHYRAQPEMKGSGVERGHALELDNCPRCYDKLVAGKHHFNCRRGLAAPRQAQKRKDRVEAGASGLARAGELPETCHASVQVQDSARPLTACSMAERAEATAGIQPSQPGPISGPRDIRQPIPQTPSPGLLHPLFFVGGNKHLLQDGIPQLPRADFQDVCMGVEVDDEVYIPKTFLPLEEASGGLPSYTAWQPNLQLSSWLLPPASERHETPPQAAI